jgi:hypothetical protein
VDPTPEPEGPVGQVIRLQREAGNRSVAGLLSRQPGPEVYDPLGAAIRETQRRERELLTVNERTEFVTLDPVPTAIMPPQTAERVIAARATLTRIPRMGAGDVETLKYAAPGAPVLELIEKREFLRTDITENQSQITRRMPPARLPDDQMAALDAELAPFTQRIQYDEAEIERTQKTIDAVVRGLGVADEAALTTLLTKDFPELFVRRAKLIAFRQLDDNVQVAQKEADRYGLGIPGMGAGAAASPASFGKPEDIKGLRLGAKRIMEIDRQIRDNEQAQERAVNKAKDDAAAAGAERDYSSGAGAGSYATPPPVMPDLSQMQIDLTRLRAEQTAIRTQFPILFRPDIDLAGLTSASDDDLSRATGAEIGKVLSNIADTKKAIASDELKVWNLRGIVDLTLLDLGIPADSPLVKVVERHAAEAQSDSGILHKALSALAIVAGIVATVASGGLALFAGGVALGIGGYEVAKSVKEYGTETAASEVALDPELADISVNDPDIMPIMINLVGMTLGAGDLVRAVKTLRMPAKALAAGGDIVSFAKAAKSVLPKEEAERFIAAAGRMAGVDEATQAAIRAVGDTYRHADLAQVTKLLEQHAEVGFAKTFDRLAATGRVHPLNADAVRYYLGDQALATFQADPLLRAWYHRQSGRLFIREGMNREAFGSWAVHETTHHLQELKAFESSLSFQGEFQAYRMQQTYLHGLERAAGEAAVPGNMRWLVNATDEQISAHVTQMYGYQAPRVLESDEMMQPLLDLLGRLEG